MAAEQSEFRRLSFDLRDGQLAAIAFGDAARAPDLLFIHATGMNALTYRDMLAPLGDRFHVIAVDARGHGRTALPARRWGYWSWNRHRDDLIELLDRHFQGAVALAGHSMGATTALLIAGKRPDLARGLCLIDPVLLTPLLAGPAPRGGGLARGARRRRTQFTSKAEAREALRGRGFFKTFPPAALMDYVEDGFVDDPSGGVRLACAPAYEAATFTAQAHDSWGALARTTCPLIVLRAEKGSTCSDAAARRVQTARPDARIATVEGSTHALPMERPDRARSAIETMLMLAEGQARFHDLE